MKELAAYGRYSGRSLPEVRQDIEKLIEIVTRWQRVQNLVSRETGDLWHRHVLDSLQILPHISVKMGGLGSLEGHNWLDLGSGGGFPALPLAIALKGSGLTYHLIESHGRKCAFLNAAKRELDLPIVVHNARIEAVEPGNIGPVSIVTSRALAALPALFGYMVPFWSEKTCAFLHKGREYGEECKLADSLFGFDMVKHISTVDPEGVILEITHLQRKAG